MSRLTCGKPRLTAQAPLLSENKLLRIQQGPGEVFGGVAAVFFAAAAEEACAAGRFGFRWGAGDDGPEELIDDGGVVFF